MAQRLLRAGEALLSRAQIVLARWADRLMGGPSFRGFPVGVLLIAAVAFSLYLYMASAPIYPYSSREFQTLSTTRALTIHFDLLRPVLDVYPPPASAALEFPLFQAGAAVLSMALGVPLESAGRFLSAGFGLLGILFMFKLSGLMLESRKAVLFSTVLFAGLPLSFHQFSRYMLDGMALTLMVAAVYFFLLVCEGRSWALWPLGLLLFILAVVKVFFLIPAWGVVLVGVVRAKLSASAGNTIGVPSAKQVAQLVVILGASLALAFAWYGWTLHFNQGSNIGWITDVKALTYQQFGDLALRFDLSYYRLAFGDLITNFPVVMLLSVVVFLPSALRRTRGAEDGALRSSLLLLLGGMAAIFVFFQVAATHAYYLVIITPGLCLIFCRVLMSLRSRRLAYAIAVLAVLSALAVTPRYLYSAMIGRGGGFDGLPMALAASTIADWTPGEPTIHLISSRLYFPEIAYLSNKQVTLHLFDSLLSPQDYDFSGAEQVLALYIYGNEPEHERVQRDMRASGFELCISQSIDHERADLPDTRLEEYRRSNGQHASC